MKSAFDLATDLMMVSVMIRDQIDHSSNSEIPFSDGIVTSWNTFQKYFRQREFKAYLSEQINADIMMASIGVAYIFKTDRFKDQYLENRVTFKRSGYMEAIPS